MAGIFAWCHLQRPTKNHALPTASILNIPKTHQYGNGITDKSFTKDRENDDDDKEVLPPPCWRPCPHGRVNTITYLVRHAAGLDDRMQVLEHLVNLAGSLCAKLYFPQPAISLAPKHNEGRRVSTDVRWSDILQMNFYDGDDAVVDFAMPWDKTAPPTPEDFVHHVLGMPNTTKMLASTTGEAVWEHFLQARSHVKATPTHQADSSKPLAWVIEKHFVNWWKTFSSEMSKLGQDNSQDASSMDAQSLPDRCDYRDTHQPVASPLVDALTDSVWYRIVRKHPSITCIFVEVIR